MISLTPNSFADSASIQQFILSPSDNMFDQYDLVRLCDGSVLPTNALRRLFLKWLLVNSNHEFRFDGPNANYKAHPQKKYSDRLISFLKRSVRMARPGEEFVSIGALVQFANLELIKDRANVDMKAKTVCTSYHQAMKEGGKIKQFYTQWFESIISEMRKKCVYTDDKINLPNVALPLMPENWKHVSTEKFIECLSGYSLVQYPGEFRRWEIDMMIAVYWDMVSDNDGLPPKQSEFMQSVVEKCNEPNTPEFRYRVGYVTYPAFVRQHHFGLMLIDHFGKNNVLGGPIVDAHYKTDWVVLDREQRPHAIHMSTLRKPSITKSTFNVFENHDLRINFNSADRVGGGAKFLLHTAEEVLELQGKIEGLS